MRIPHFPVMHFFDHPKILMALSFSWGTVSLLFDKYIFNDWKFLPFLVIAIGINTITGMWKALKLHNFSAFEMVPVVKVIVYGLFLVIVHGLTYFSEIEAVVIAFSWVQQTCYAGLIVRESVSSVENFGVIAPGLLPKWILRRLKDFDEHGRFTGDTGTATPEKTLS